MAMEDVIVSKFIQLLAQSEDPLNVLANIAQLWMSDGTETGNMGDVYAKLHKDGDPGENVTYKLLDYAYATFFGVRQTITAAATVNLTAGAYDTAYCVVDQDMTINITGGNEGQKLCFILKQDATGDWVITFGTGFNASGTQTAGAGEYSVVLFWYDTDNSLWQQVAGGGGVSDHNSLSGLQGGEPPDEYYHLSEEDYNTILMNMWWA